MKLIETNVDSKWVEIDGVVWGISEDGRVLHGEDGSPMSEEWHCQNEDLVNLLRAA